MKAHKHDESVPGVMQVPLRINVKGHLQPARAQDLYQTLRGSFGVRVLRPSSRTRVRMQDRRVRDPFRSPSLYPLEAGGRPHKHQRAGPLPHHGFGWPLG